MILQCESDPGAQQVRLVKHSVCRFGHLFRIAKRSSPQMSQWSACNCASWSCIRLCMLALTRHVDANLQVLRKLFPGTLLCHDVCALTSLPKVQLILCQYPDTRHPIGHWQATGQYRRQSCLLLDFPALMSAVLGCVQGFKARYAVPPIPCPCCTMLSNASMPCVHFRAAESC